MLARYPFALPRLATRVGVVHRAISPPPTVPIKQQPAAKNRSCPTMATRARLAAFALLFLLLLAPSPSHASEAAADADGGAASGAVDVVCASQGGSDAVPAAGADNSCAEEEEGGRGICVAGGSEDPAPVAVPSRDGEEEKVEAALQEAGVVRTTPDLPFPTPRRRRAPSGARIAPGTCSASHAPDGSPPAGAAGGAGAARAGGAPAGCQEHGACAGGGGWPAGGAPVPATAETGR